MTAGHKHRNLHVKPGGLVQRLLHIRIARTSDVTRADHSRFVWRALPDGTCELRLLGVLHALTGLVVVYE